MHEGDLAHFWTMQDDRRLQADDDLIRLMLDGDESAFTALYRRHQSSVFRFALHMSGSIGVAEDTVQDVFLILMREAGNYDPARGHLGAYLYGIARNYVLRRLAKDRSLVPIQRCGGDNGDANGLAPGTEPAASGDPLSELTRNEMIESVRFAVLALPPRYREVVVLCDLHELSYVDAAAALDCAVGTVRSRLHRARKLLCEKLRSSYEADADSQPVKTARCLI
jgi:RNA polymerase sigma-70 factor (ECF subfamily)